MAGDVNVAPPRREARRVILIADLAGFTRAVGPLDTRRSPSSSTASTPRPRHASRITAAGSSSSSATAAWRSSTRMLRSPRLPVPASSADCSRARHGVRYRARRGCQRTHGDDRRGRVRRRSPARRSSDRRGGDSRVPHGCGPGIRISEPVFRRLPNDQRGAWKKRQPPGHLHLGRIRMSTPVADAFPSGVVTFLMSDVEESGRHWAANARQWARRC